MIDKDLALFLIIISVPIFCFAEISMMWGFIALGVGSIIFIYRFQEQTKLLK